MRITYRTLGKLIERMSEFQLDCDVTVDVGLDATQFYAGELRINDDDLELDENHPVIYTCYSGQEQRRDDVENISNELGLNSN